MRHFFLALLWILCLTAPTATMSAVIRVPADQSTIQAGLDAAQSGDVVLVAAGNYNGPGNFDLDFHGRSIYLRSEDGALATVLDSGARGFHFDDGETSAARVEGFTIKNGFVGPDGSGGAFFTHGSAPTITQCIFESNAFSAVRCVGASPTFVDCSFTGNNITTPGWNGGAMRCEANSNLQIQSCEFAGNTSSSGAIGGAIYCDDSALHIRDSWFADNLAEGGGAIWCTSASRVTIFNSIFVGNNGDNLCGAAIGIGIGAPTLEVIGSTFYGNSCSPGAGGVAIANPNPLAEVRVANCIIAANTGGEAITGCVEEITCTDIYGNPGGDWTGCFAGELGVAGNISADPEFCDAAARDFTLDGQSPCAPPQTAPECGLLGALGIGCGVTGLAGGPSAQRFPKRLRVHPNPTLGAAEFNVAGESAWVDIYTAGGRRVDSIRVGTSTLWTPPRALGTGVFLARPRGDTEAAIKITVVH